MRLFLSFSLFISEHMRGDPAYGHLVQKANHKKPGKADSGLHEYHSILPNQHGLGVTRAWPPLADPREELLRLGSIYLSITDLYGP